MTSIRRTLLWSLLGSLLVVAALTTAVTYVSIRRDVNAVFDLQLRQLALSTRIDELVRGRRSEFGNEENAESDRTPDLVTQIWDRQGVLVYYSRPGMGLPVPAGEGYANVHLGHRDWRVYTTSVRGQVVQVAHPLAEREEIVQQTARRTLLPLLGALPLFALLIWMAVGRGLRPLNAMSRQLSERRVEALAPLPPATVAELAPLTQSLNELLARLDNALTAQRRFTADAAHELRTPLTALKLQLELASRAAEPEARTASISELTAGVERASRLVEQLLALARLEPEALAGNLVATDLVAIAREAIIDHALLAGEKKIDLGFALAPDDKPVLVHGEASSLRTLASNLLDNALRHTLVGGSVDVTVKEEPQAVILSVADTGPGIAPSERERVFDRFYRSPDNREPGSGLGLSIVRRIAEAHHAQITLTAPDAGSGTIVRVLFPVTRPT